MKAATPRGIWQQADDLANSEDLDELLSVLESKAKVIDGI